MDVTLHQLACFDAVVTEGGFQAAAEKIGRSQPSVFLAVKNLESHVGLDLLDRGGYRVALTEAGRSFHERARMLLGELQALKSHAMRLGAGEEVELRGRDRRSLPAAADPRAVAPFLRRMSRHPPSPAFRGALRTLGAPVRWRRRPHSASHREERPAPRIHRSLSGAPRAGRRARLPAISGHQAKSRRSRCATMCNA